MSSSVGKIVGKNSPFLIHLKSETKAAFTQNGVKQYMVAGHLGVSDATVSNWLNVNEPDWPTWDKWQEMMAYVQSIWGTIDAIRPMAHWFNTDLVGSYSDPRFALDRKILGRIAGVLASKSGKVLTYLVQIIEDGVIDPDEEAGLAQLDPEIVALMCAVKDLRDRCRAQKEAKRKAS